MKRNKPAIRRWVKALRSGKYERICGGLRWNGKYCPLGVACRISRKARQVETDCVGFVNYEGPAGDTSGSRLPRGLRKYLGIDRGEQETIWKMNDVYGESFDEIADWIESRILGE